MQSTNIFSPENLILCIKNDKLGHRARTLSTYSNGVQKKGRKKEIKKWEKPIVRKVAVRL